MTTTFQSQPQLDRGLNERLIEILQRLSSADANVEHALKQLGAFARPNDMLPVSNPQTAPEIPNADITLRAIERLLDHLSTHTTDLVNIL